MNAALQGFTVWSEVSMMTVNPVLVLSPTHRTSKLSVFIHLFCFLIVSENIKYHVSIIYHVCVLFSKTYLCQFLLFYICKYSNINYMFTGLFFYGIFKFVSVENLCLCKVSVQPV